MLVLIGACSFGAIAAPAPDATDPDTPDGTSPTSTPDPPAATTDVPQPGDAGVPTRSQADAGPTDEAAKTPSSPPPSVDSGAPAALEPTVVVTKADARRLLSTPARSLSVGATSAGSLVGGVKLPYEGKGFRIFKHMRSRKTNYGTDELISLVKHASERVAAAFPGTVVVVGNMGFRTGGKIPWSVSHRAGRDVDLGIFAHDTKRNVPINPPAMMHHEPDGTTSNGRYRFDPARNLELVRALVAAPGARVQYIFIADWLKTKMLAEAARIGVPDEEVERLDAVLHQPSDSNPHADHFHVRIYCSDEDRLHGCHNWGPVREWLDLGDAPYDRRVSELLAVLELGDKGLERQAVEKLGAIAAVDAVPSLLRRLARPAGPTRSATLAALSKIRAPEVVVGLGEALAQAVDPRWALRLMDTLVELDHPETLPIALRVVSRAPGALHTKLKKRDELMTSASTILARYGREPCLAPLVTLLESDSAKVRLAAHDALVALTNQKIRAGKLGFGSQRLRRPVVRRWQRFVREHGDKTWLDWQLRGFQDRGHYISDKGRSPRGIDSLIRAINARDARASANAVHVLSEITGHAVNPRWRTQRNNHRHWTSWWRKNKDLVDFTTVPSDTAKFPEGR